MARRHGRNASILIDTGATAGAGVPVTVSLFNDWSLDLSRDRTDATVFGDANIVELAGLPKGSVKFDGLIDLGTSNYKNLADGNARGFYLYPDATNHATLYWWGTAVFDASFTGSVSDTVKASVTGSAASNIVNVGGGI